MLNIGLSRIRLGRRREEMGTIAEQFAQCRVLKDKVRKEKEKRWEPLRSSFLNTGLSRIRLGRRREEMGIIAEQFAQYRALKDKVSIRRRRLT